MELSVVNMQNYYYNTTMKIIKNFICFTISISLTKGTGGKQVITGVILFLIKNLNAVTQVIQQHFKPLTMLRHQCFLNIKEVFWKN